jgi:hypothetical protein
VPAGRPFVAGPDEPICGDFARQRKTTLQGTTMKLALGHKTVNAVLHLASLAAALLATREGPNAQTLVVPIQVSGKATAAADCASLGASIDFPAQMSMVMVKIVPVADTLVEGAETVVVTLAIVRASPWRARFATHPRDWRHPACLLPRKGSCARCRPTSPGALRFLHSSRRHPQGAAPGARDP